MKPTSGGLRMGKPAPAVIEHKKLRFLITDRPTDATLPKYIEELEKHHVTDVVRVCEASYKTDQLVEHGIQVLDWPFDDGKEPPAEVINAWVELIRARFLAAAGGDANSRCVAIHCVAGLGRAPVMVALALMEGGMKFEDAVELIREKRKGAINSRQLDFLRRYKPKARLRSKNGQKCSVM